MRTIRKVMIYTSGITIMLVMLYITGDVFGRYFLNSPLPASFEVSKMLMILVFFWALAYVQARQGHLTIEFLHKNLSPGGQSIVNILTSLIGACVFAVIAWQVWDLGVENLKEGEYVFGAWKIPYYPARFACSIGASVVFIQYIVDLVGSVSNTVRIFRSKQ